MKMSQRSTRVRLMRRGHVAGVAGATLLLVTSAASCGRSHKGPVAVLGDSITALSNDTLHATLDGHYTISVIGKFGARTDEALDEATLLARADPEQAIINLGTNDAIQDVPAERTGANLDKLVATFRGATCIGLVTIDEQMTAFGVSHRASAAAVNAQIRRIADAVDTVSVIDWTQLVAGHGGVAAMTTDGVHPNPTGMQVLADAYLDALNDC